MTTTDAILYKLRGSIRKCSPNGVARPLWVSDVCEIIEFIEATQAAYREPTPYRTSATASTATPSVHAVRDSELEATSQ